MVLLTLFADRARKSGRQLTGRGKSIRWWFRWRLHPSDHNLV